METDCEVRLEDRYHPHRNLGRGSLLWGAGSPCPPQMNPEGEMTMKPDYRNWMPRGMIVGLGTATGVLAAGSAAAVRSRLPMGRTAKHLAGAVLGLALWDVWRGRRGACTPGRCFPTRAGGSCPGRSSRASPHTLNFRRAAWAWMWVRQRALTIACAKRQPPGSHGGHRPLGRGIRLLQPETL